MPTRPQPAVHFTPPKNHRFLQLDALRGLAALFVVIYHFPSEFRSLLLPRSSAFLAVDFFFCLSGFVIAFSYEKRLLDQLSFLDFLIARVVRLWPLYLLGTCFGVLSLLLITRTVPLHALLSPHWLGLMGAALLLLPDVRGPLTAPLFPLDHPAWSLFFEMCANLVYALLLKARLARNLALGLFAGLSLLWMLSHLLHGVPIDQGWVHATLFFGFARVGLSFTAGVLVYRFYRSRPHTRFTNLPWWLLCAFTAAALAATLISPLPFMNSETFRLLDVAVFFPLLVYLGVLVKVPHRFSTITAFWGDLSYPLYVLHVPFLDPLFGRTFARLHAAQPRLFMLVLITVPIVLAVFTWALGKYYDAPVRRFLTKKYNLLKQRHTPAAVLVTTTGS